MLLRKGVAACTVKAKSFKLLLELLEIFYTSVICYIMTLALVCWGGKQDRNKLSKNINKAGVVGRAQNGIKIM